MRGLLVDFGGVLTTNVFDSFKAFCVKEGLDPDTVRRLFREDQEALAQLRELERGELTEEEFSERFAPLLGIDEPYGLVDRLFAGMEADEAMVEAVKTAKRSSIKTALISNSWGRGRYDRELFPVMFDDVVISGEVGLHKPEPEIYLMGAQKIGLPPEECVFVDDLKENITGAEGVGMTGILHRGAQTTIPRLEELLGIALRHEQA